MNSADRRSGENAQQDADRVMRHEYDWSTTKPSTAVVRSVALAADRDPRDLEILQQVVDTDGLDAIMKADSTDSSGPSIMFGFAGYEVTVHSDGFLVVRPAESDTV